MTEAMYVIIGTAIGGILTGIVPMIQARFDSAKRQALRDRGDFAEEVCAYAELEDIAAEKLASLDPVNQAARTWKTILRDQTAAAGKRRPGLMKGRAEAAIGR
jgi:hypothetical protein